MTSSAPLIASVSGPAKRVEVATSCWPKVICVGLNVNGQHSAGCIERPVRPFDLDHSAILRRKQDAPSLRRQLDALIAALRPLNNVTTTAIAVEVAPPSDDVSQLNSPAYQQLIASAVAAGVAAFRDRLEAGR